MACARVSAKSAITMEAALEAASAEFNHMKADVKPAIAYLNKLFAKHIPSSKCYIASIGEDRDDGPIICAVFAGSYDGPFAFSSTESDVVAPRVSIGHSIMETALEAAGAEFDQLMADVEPAIAYVNKLFAAPIASKCYIANIDEDRGDGTIFCVVFASYDGPFSFSTGSDIVALRVSIGHLMHKPADPHKNQYLDDYIKLKLKTFMRLFHAALNDDDGQYVSIDRILDLIE